MTLDLLTFSNWVQLLYFGAGFTEKRLPAAGLPHSCDLPSFSDEKTARGGDGVQDQPLTLKMPFSFHVCIPHTFTENLLG